MIDLTLLRESPEEVIKKIETKDPSFPIKRLIELDAQVREFKNNIEQARHEKNELAKKGSQVINIEIRQQSIKISETIHALSEKLTIFEKEFKELYLLCPNIPDKDLPIGGKEKNLVVKVFGEKPKFTFSPKNHLELGNAQGWFDFQSAGQIAGSNIPLYKGQAVNLLFSLAIFMLKNNKKHGYEPILPSVLVNEKTLIAASNFPKFKDQVYAIPADDLYLTPTAEVNLASLYADTIFSDGQLPKHMTAWTSCFRREAGGYGAQERGLIRIHQFEKVELYTICEPEQSNHELDKMVACAESILQQLGLHYRISLLATQDCSFAAAKTYDIEVWLPGQGAYYEVSSISNCKDFQARRALMRSKQAHDTRTKLVHTLNGSSLALPRLMVAIMETYQQADGKIVFPDFIEKLLVL